MTGSSLIPAAGAKKRETKSKPGELARAVTTTPRARTAPSAPKSGVIARTTDSLSTSTRESNAFFPTYVGRTPRVRVRLSRPWGASASCSGVAGKSRTIAPSRLSAGARPGAAMGSIKTRSAHKSLSSIGRDSTKSGARGRCRRALQPMQIIRSVCGTRRGIPNGTSRSSSGYLFRDKR